MENKIKTVTNNLAVALMNELNLRQQEMEVKIALVSAHSYTLSVEDELRQLKQDMLQYTDGRSSTIKGKAEEKETPLTAQTAKGSRYTNAKSGKGEIYFFDSGRTDRSDASLNSKKRIGYPEIRLGESNTTN